MKEYFSIILATCLIITNCTFNTTLAHIFLASPSLIEISSIPEFVQSSFLPSENDLLAIGRKEKAFILTHMRKDDPRLEMLQEVSNTVHFNISRGCGVLKQSHLRQLAGKVHFTFAELREYLDMPTWAETLVVVKEGDKTSSHHANLMEEVFHVLEGDFEAHPNWMRGRPSRYIAEVVNDFLQLMFYPEDNVEQFKSEYTMWNPAQCRKLLKIYRQNRNPNFHIRAIIQKLLKDVKDKATIWSGQAHIPLITLLFSSKPDEYSFFISPYDMQVFLNLLLETEHFSHHQPLFPNWKIERDSRSDQQQNLQTKRLNVSKLHHIPEVNRSK